MPNISIDTASVIVTPVGEATKAYVFSKDTAGNFHQTDELKTDENGIQIWNIPARVVIPGVPAPIATKVTMASDTQPTGYRFEYPAEVHGLSMSVFGNLALSISGIGAQTSPPTSKDSQK